MIETPPVLTPDSGSSRRIGRFGSLLLIGQLAWALPGTVSGTLLQALAAEIDPHEKIAIYTSILVAGGVASAVGTVVGGLLSDRTRSRLGRRSPWLLGSSILAALALVGAGSTTSPILIGVSFALFQAGVGAWVAALSAIIPDHVAQGSVGKASAFSGFGFLLGQTIGGVIAGTMVLAPSRGLIVVPWTMVVAAIVIALLLRDPDNRHAADAPRRPSVRDFVPPGGRDFWLAFSGRFLFILSIVMLSTFSLFLLTDYLHLTTAHAGEVVSFSTLLFGVLAAVGVIVAGPLSDRLGRTKPFVFVAPVLVGAVLIPLLLSPSVTTFVVFYAATGLAFGVYISVDQALMVAVLPNRGTAARDLGFLSIGSTLPSVVAPLVGGALAGTLGYASIFVASLILGLLAALVILGIRRVR